MVWELLKRKYIAKVPKWLRNLRIMLVKNTSFQVWVEDRKQYGPSYNLLRDRYCGHKYKVFSCLLYQRYLFWVVILLIFYYRLVLWRVPSYFKNFWIFIIKKKCIQLLYKLKPAILSFWGLLATFWQTASILSTVRPRLSLSGVLIHYTYHVGWNFYTNSNEWWTKMFLKWTMTGKDNMNVNKVVHQ